MKFLNNLVNDANRTSDTYFNILYLSAHWSRLRTCLHAADHRLVSSKGSSLADTVSLESSISTSTGTLPFPRGVVDHVGPPRAVENVDPA